MRIEPTARCWRATGFEDQGGHQTPVASGSASDYLPSGRFQALRRYFVDVGGQFGSADDPLQWGTHQCLPLLVVFAPAGEQLDHAGCYLRVQAVEGQHLIGQEFVTGAAAVMETDVIDPREAADQGIDLVGVPDLECGMRQQ